MRRFLEGIDFHVTVLLISLSLIPGCTGFLAQRLGWGQWLGWCCVGFLVVVPQPMILTHSIGEDLWFAKRKALYLLANEIQVALFAGISVGLWFLVAWLWPLKP
jgi:hypothetical protein